MEVAIFSNLQLGEKLGEKKKTYHKTCNFRDLNRLKYFTRSEVIEGSSPFYFPP